VGLESCKAIYKRRIAQQSAVHFTFDQPIISQQRHNASLKFVFKGCFCWRRCYLLFLMLIIMLIALLDVVVFCICCFCCFCSGAILQQSATISSPSGHQQASATTSSTQTETAYNRQTSSQPETAYNYKVAAVPDQTQA
jgi:hypothetical protein